MRVCVLDDHWTTDTTLQNRLRSVIRTVDPSTDWSSDIQGFTRRQDFLDHLHRAQENKRLPDLMIIDENLGDEEVGSVFYDRDIGKEKEFARIPVLLFTQQPELRRQGEGKAAKHLFCHFEMKSNLLPDPDRFVDIVKKLLAHARAAPVAGETRELWPLRMDRVQQRLFIRGREVRAVTVPVRTKSGKPGRKRLFFRGRLAKVLWLLMTAHGFVTRPMILNEVQDTDDLDRTDEQLRHADQYVLRLRDLLKVHGCHEMLESFPGQGWRLVELSRSGRRRR